MAIFAFFGLQGSKLDWIDIPIYPNEAKDFGISYAHMFYEDFKADLYISLVDIWVLKGLDTRINWVSWTPIDHDPVPPMVVDVFKNSPNIVVPLTQSRFGQRALKKAGVDAVYIPNDFDTKLYAPKPEWRELARKTHHWDDKFVIGTVATNHDERKNYRVAMQAVKIFAEKHPGEVIYYTHTNPTDERGINLLALRKELGIQDFTYCPSMVQMITGIDRETMSRTYNSFDVFLLPTKGEGFCRPILEAESCGVPVITTKCTSHEELVKGGWFIKDLIPFWTKQESWQFDCHVEEVVDCLEKAYQAKKDGSIIKRQKEARKEALKYDASKIYPKYWKPFLEDMANKITQPKDWEGVQEWRGVLIPQTCAPRKVLDIGCGVTTPYKDLLEHLGEYIGLDKKGGEGVLKVDAHKLPFRDKEVGFVWMSELLEHVDDPQQVIDEAKRVGVHGVCLFSTPQQGNFKGDPDHRIVRIPYITTSDGAGLINW